MIALVLVAGIPMAAADDFMTYVFDAGSTADIFHGLGIGRGRSETPEEMMYADFARESFKQPGHRRDLHGYTAFDSRSVKYENGTCNMNGESCEHGLDPITFAIWTKEAQEGSSEKNSLVFALRGTPLSNLGDLSPDDEGVVDIAIGEFTHCDRAKKALMTLRAIEKQFDGYRITMTGHSLGGTTVLALLAQDAHNDIIEKEDKSTSASSVDAVYVYNPYRGGITGYVTEYFLKRPIMEPFYKLAMTDERFHGCFIFGDLLSKFTKYMAQNLPVPSDRLFIGEVPEIMHRFPPLSYPYAHNMDGTKGTCRLTSPDYTFGDEE